MQKQKLIPTPLVLEKEVKPIEIVEPKDPKFREAMIWFYIGRWILGTVWMKITGRDSAAISARRVRELMEELGFLWIKFGQLISLRDDFLSDELCEELSKLQHRVHGFPPEISRRTIEEELGGPVEQFFEDFEEYPFAAASISQVHRARLKENGVDVAVKVMRPGAIEIFDKDMNFFRFIFKTLDKVPSLSYFRLSEGLWELERIVSEEMDYRYEVSNIRRFRKNTRKHKNIYIPKPFTQYCTGQVLVMEMIKGTLMSDYLRMRKQDPARVDTWLQENHVKPKRVAKHLLFSLMRQMFEENMFHGDLHPGNIILLRNNHVALIDLGCLGTLGQHFLKIYLAFMRALSTGEYHKTADLFLALMPQLPSRDFAHLKQRLVRTLRAWEMRSHLKNIPYHEKSIVSASGDLGRLISEYQISMTWTSTRIDRTYATLDASLNDLIPEANYPKLYGEYFKERGERTLRRMFSAKTVRSTVRELPEQIGEMQFYLEPVIRRMGMVFSGGLSKISHVLAFACKTGARAMFLTGVFLSMTLLYQQGRILTSKYPYQNVLWALQRWVKLMPVVAAGEWVVLILIALGLIIPLRKLAARFSELEIRLPFVDKAA